MNNFIQIFFFVLLGLVLQRVKRFPKSIYRLLNKIVIYFCLPAITLSYIPKIVWDQSLLFPISAAWICFAFAILLFQLLGSWLGWSKKLIGCLILTAGFSNTSFLGFPIIQALYGKEALKIAVLVDQPGTFVAVSTIGVVVAAFYSRGSSHPIEILKRIVMFPPFLAFVLACAMNIFGYDWLGEVQGFLGLISTLVTPLAMLSVGLQLNFDKKSKHFPFLRLGLLFKLVLMPLLILIIYVWGFHHNNETIDITILEMAMAPMITACILASTYGLKPRLCSMMVGFGIPISFITIGIWWLILTYLI